MICDLCRKNEAVVFLEKMEKNTRRTINLCVNCAMARGIQASNITTSKTNLDAIFQEIQEKKADSNPDMQKLCPVCGKSLGEIKLNGIAGCPECYEVFKDEIIVSMNAHGIKGRYTGTLPKRVKNFRNTLTDRIDLQLKLEEAVRMENYEKAAVYRDYLKALEKGFVSDGDDNDEAFKVSEDKKEF